MRRARRTPHSLAVVALVVAAATGCGGSGSSSPAAAPSPAGSTSSAPAGPVGIIAIGHSGLTGENSDPSLPGQPVYENSWATGTTPRVDSVYARLVAARPETEGHVANSAQGGAPVEDLKNQASLALRAVPQPQLVVIQTIDNDIRCDGTDAQNARAFGATLRRALAFVTGKTPTSQILVVGQLGRPSTAYIRRLVAAHPEVKSSLTGSGPCDFYDEQGQLNRASFVRLTGIVDTYEAWQERICALFPRCHTDGGVRRTWQDRLAYFTPDFNHLDVRGLAVEAAQIWPVVAHLLHVS